MATNEHSCKSTLGDGLDAGHMALDKLDVLLEDLGRVEVRLGRLRQVGWLRQRQTQRIETVVAQSRDVERRLLHARSRSLLGRWWKKEREMNIVYHKLVVQLQEALERRLVTAYHPIARHKQGHT